MKYPLTDNAKAAARQLVEAWDAGVLSQNVKIVFTGDNTFDIAMGLNWPSSIPIIESKATWYELNLFNLIHVSLFSADGWEIILLQELRNAVATDFEVSEYFLTLNAVGNIIINSTTGNVQGMGINTGIANLTIEEVANTLESALGAEFLAQQQALKEAIDSLRTSLDSDKQSKLGKVISELGNSLQHGANAYAVTQAIVALAPALKPLLGLG